MWKGGCSAPERFLDSDMESELRFLVVADPHLLSVRRGPIDKYWIDYQVRNSLDYAVGTHAPTDVLIMGDIFDWGKSSDVAEWKDNKRRYIDVFLGAVRGRARVHSVVGNHDVGDRTFLRASNVKQYEETVGSPTNWRRVVCSESGRTCLTLVGLNSMALGGTPLDPHVAAQTRKHVDNVVGSAETVDEMTWDNVLDSADPIKVPIVLLVHQPLFRRDDTDCGAERSQESGHVTYGHPSAPLRANRGDVVDPDISRRLLNDMRPELVLSGHTHAICRHRHEMGALEITTPAFGWRMRPDPGYVVVDMSIEEESEPPTLRIVRSMACPLPHEHVTFVVIIFLLGVSGVLLVVSGLHWALGRVGSHLSADTQRKPKRR